MEEIREEKDPCLWGYMGIGLDLGYHFGVEKGDSVRFWVVCEGSGYGDGYCVRSRYYTLDTMIL